MTDTFEAPALERSRWAALIVLCVGVLMMVLVALGVALAVIRDPQAPAAEDTEPEPVDTLAAA
jgi:hypothetical protein